jgi:hypothetical protein
MKKYLIVFLFLISIQIGYSQSNQLWKGYFSYNEIKDLSQSPDVFFAASENALFSENLNTNTLKVTNTIDGLSGQTITSIHHSLAVNKTLVGYENGLMIVINDNDGTMFNLVGIIQKQIPSNIKKINHFTEKDGIVYVSCGFGIVQFNLNTLEFGDTYFLGSSVSDYLEVLQTTIFNNAIYAVTRNNGIKKGDLSNLNLNDFSQWQTFDSGFWNGIATIGNQLVASNANNVLYKWNGNVSISFFSYNENTVDFRVDNNRLVATNASKVVIFNDQLIPVAQISSVSIPDINAKFSCATVVNDDVYIGTLENGVITTTISSPTVFKNNTPDGPSRNALFAINASTDNLWAVYGGYNIYYNPFIYNSVGTVNSYGISKYSVNGWENKPYSTVLGAKSLSRITVNPNNRNQVYVSSYFSGLLKVENDIPTTLYNQGNSGLESLFNSQSPSSVDIRINGTAFDKSGNLWVTNSRIKNALKVFKTNNTWQSVSFENISSQYQANDYGNIAIDKNGTKWISTSKDGVIGYNENGNLLKKITFGADNGNLPTVDVRAVAIDTKNQLWIGTAKGLRVLSSVDRFLSAEQMTANNIVILEDNLAQELLYEQFITDIVVDGANRKWIGTADSGVFLFSPNGQETIYHFTTTNSPLPSNAITDIDINGVTGEVFLATTRGMLSFKGVSTKANEDLNNVIVYPNPVRPEFEGTVKVSGLLNKCNVKITDIEGNLVYEVISEGGTIEWDTKAFGKYKVASGVYMVFISAEDGVETKVKKVMIIR